MTFKELISSKIITTDVWTSLREQHPYQRVVFTNGCFDILHRGHVQYLAEARDLGDCLVVGLNSDASVKRLKGDERPINGQHDRALLLAALESVSHVIIFDEDTPAELIQQVCPDILVKGGDYTLDAIVGADFVIQRGGTVRVIPFVDGYSTTSTIQKMSQQPL